MLWATMRWLSVLVLLLVICARSYPADKVLAQRYLWTWDHRMDWSEKTAGRMPMGGGGKYHKAPEEFLEDYKKLVDYMADHTSFNAVIIWGFLRDTHGGVAAGQELCRYANERGIRIVPGVGTSGYEGYYFEGNHKYNVTTWLREHPELRALKEDGTPRNALCPTRPENIKWLNDGCRWLFETFEIGGINFEIGDFFVCHCEGCKAARAAIPGDAEDYYKDMALSTAPVAKLAHEVDPDAWLSYATYTGFTPEMMDNKPDWVDLIPGEILCQWTLTGMGSDAAWPPGVVPPTPRNTGYLHWGNKSTASLNHIFLNRVRDICQRADAAGFEGLATYGEDPPSRFSMRVFYEAWSYFMDHPAATVEEFADMRLAEWFDSRDDGRQLLTMLLGLERSGASRATVAQGRDDATTRREQSTTVKARRVWDELIAFLAERQAEIEAGDRVVDDPGELAKLMAEGFRVEQETLTRLVLSKPAAETLELKVRVDYNMENGILPVMRLKCNGTVLGPEQAIDRRERILTPRHGGYADLDAYDVDREAWRVKYDTDFTLNNWRDRKYDTEDYDPVFRFRIGDLWREGPNEITIENLEQRFRPTERGVLVVGHLRVQ